jgi:multiple sugar transport system permease protein
MAANTTNKSDFRLNYLDRNVRKMVIGGILTLFTFTVLGAYLLPFGYMLMTSVKDRQQISRNTILPLTQLDYTYQGQELPNYRVQGGDRLAVYNLPTEDGVRQVALVREGGDGEPHIFLDTFLQTIIEWEGELATLEPAQQVELWTYREDDNPDLGLFRSKAYPTFNVDTEDGSQIWALIRAPEHTFVNVDTPTAPVITSTLDITSLQSAPAIAVLRYGPDPELGIQLPANFDVYESPDGEGRWAYVPATADDQVDVMLQFDPATEAVLEKIAWEGDLSQLQPIYQPMTYRYRGDDNPDIGIERNTEYPVYQVPDGDSVRELALVQTGSPNVFIDFANEDNVTAVEWSGEVESLAPVYEQRQWRQAITADRANGYRQNEFYPVYLVETENGVQEWALVREGTLTDESIFVNTENIDEVEIHQVAIDLEEVEPVTEVVEYTHRSSPVPEWSLAPGDELLLYESPLESGKEWALVRGFTLDSGRETVWLDPENPDDGVFFWSERYFDSLGTVDRIAPNWENYPDAWNQIDFPRLLFNTAFIAIAGLIGTLISCTVVAYGFARFPIPGKNVLFIILIATIVLPRQVTLVPTYAFFSEINWTNTWLPLIVPHFFANAYNVFLLRQFIQTIPRAMDEAAMIDGAGPIKILTHIIVPQAWPALVAAGLFHIVFAWNDYFEPLIYTLGNEDIQPISVGIQQFNFIYNERPEFIQATSLMALVLPVLLFIFSQRYFMRGVVITGVDK